MNLVDLAPIYSDTKQTIAYLREKSLLKRHYICCGEMCSEVKSKSRDGFEFYCKLCFHRYSVRTGSIFFNVHVPITILLLLTYLFSVETSISVAHTHVKGKASRQFIILWYAKL